MLNISKENRLKLQPHAKLLKHVADGGSAPRIPTDELYGIYKASGGADVMLWCGSCVVDMIKSLHFALETNPTK